MGRKGSGGSTTVIAYCAERLRRAREAKGITVPDLAERCDGEPSEGTIRNIEAARHAPQLDTLVRLASGLQVSVGSLLPPESPYAWERVASSFDLSYEDARLLRRL